jgi:stringent starvation protein B
MANTDQLRDRASRLLAMAISAREKGQGVYADRLTEQAADFLDAAKAAESVAAKQQQQPQPEKE